MTPPAPIRRALRGEAMRRCAGRAIGAYLGVALRSTRWTVQAPASSWGHLTGADNRTAIVAFWHEMLPLAPALWRQARRANPDLRVSVLISRHRDGRMITDIIGRWRMDAVAGSSDAARPDPGRAGRDKGGAAALRQMLALLRDGSLVAITPDGPRGPRRVLQPGVASLAALSGVPVIAVGCATDRHRRLGSWDSMVLPLPFGRGSIVCSAPIAVPPGDRAGAAAEIAASLDAASDRARQAAERAAPARRPAIALALWQAAATAATPAVAFLLRRRLRRGKEIAHRLPERRGRHPGRRPDGRLLWLHAASVGETLSLLPLLAALRRHDPVLTLLLTTGTVTAQRLAERRLAADGAAADARTLVRLAALDVPAWIGRFLRHWRPDGALLVESELWPSLLAGCLRRGVPLMLVNARLSERSARRWAALGTIARPLFAGFRWIAARSEADAARLRGLGAARVFEAGDLKRVSAPLPFDAAELSRLRVLLGDRPCWLAASTHEGEEAVAVAAHEALRSRHPDLLTIIVPRHPDRAGAIAALAPMRRRGAGEDPPPDAGLWLCDTLGELGLFYRLCDLALLGNSLPEAAGPGGGHNPLEPARLGCALAAGPRLHNFAADAALLRKAGALAVLPDRDALCAWLDGMLSDPAARAASASAARRACPDDAEDGLADRLARRVLDTIASAPIRAGADASPHGGGR